MTSKGQVTIPVQIRKLLGLQASDRVAFVVTQGKVESDDFGRQIDQAFRNVVRIVQEAGGRASDIVRMTWFITDKAAYNAAGPAIGAAYKETIGRHFPTITVVFVAALVDDRARVEIEATAFIAG